MDDAEPAICETFQQMIDNDEKKLHRRNKN